MGCIQCSASENKPLSPISPQLFYLEEQRRLRLQQLATLIQKVYRGWRCRTHYQQMRKSQILISAWFRGNKVLPLPKHHVSHHSCCWAHVWLSLTVPVCAPYSKRSTMGRYGRQCC